MNFLRTLEGLGEMKLFRKQNGDYVKGVQFTHSAFDDSKAIEVEDKFAYGCPVLWDGRMYIDDKVVHDKKTNECFTTVNLNSGISKLRLNDWIMQNMEGKMFVVSKNKVAQTFLGKLPDDYKDTKYEYVEIAEIPNKHSFEFNSNQ